MAANLIKTGHDVMLYNRTPGKAAALGKQGARVAADVAAACRGDVVVTMLADDAAVESVVFGDRGVIATLGKGMMHISMSTTSVELSQRLAAAHGVAGQRFVAAPVFGRPEAAAAAKLFIVAGGAPEDVEACTPVFQSLGQKTIHIAEAPQAANLVKLSGNFLLASVVQALGEAMALVAKAGVDRRRYVDLLTSTLFTGPVFTTYGPLIAEQKFEPAGFAASLGEKDIRLALAAAEMLRVPMPLASLVHDRLLTVIARGGEALDWSAIGKLAAEDAGLHATDSLTGTGPTEERKVRVLEGEQRVAPRSKH